MIRRFASRFLVLALNQSKQNFLAKQFKLDPQVIEAVAEYDPSPNNTYTAWLCKVYKADGEDLKALEALKPALSKFMKLMNSPDFPQDKRDIGKYDSKELLDLVGSDRKFRRSLSQTEIERQIMSDGLPGAELIWNSGNFKMWHVTNINYAMFLSSNTAWCTAQPHHARNYCSNGGLYPVYYKNKPFCQGHVEQSSGTIAFLDKADRAMSVDNTTFLTFLDVVDLPLVHAFGNFVFRNSSLRNKIETLASSEDPKDQAMILHFEKLALKFKNAYSIYGILKGLDSGGNKQWWPEGFEFLLDFPSLLLPLLSEISIPEQLKTEAPELLEEILYELGKSEKYLDASKATKLMIQLTNDPEIIDKYLDENIGTLDLGGGDWPELVSRITQRIEALNPEDTTQNLLPFTDFFAHNQYNASLKEAALNFWRKFVKCRWDSVHDILEDEPEYKARVEEQKERVTKPRVGTTVTTAPGYMGENAMETGKIIAVEDTEVKLYGIDEVGFTVKVQWNNGKEEELTILPEVGDYLPLEKRGTTIKGYKIDPDQKNFKKGDKVIPSSSWDKDESRIDTLATITWVETDEDKNTFINVQFDSDDESSNGWFSYRFTRVIESELSQWPEALKPGQKVKAGPTFSSHFNTSGLIGVIKDDDQDGWVQVEWGEDKYHAIHRYGMLAGDSEIPFRLDVMPEEVNFKLPKNGKDYNWANINESTAYGLKVLALSKAIAEEYE